MAGASTCETCGSSEFFLENGKYFCSICQLQQVGKSFLVAKPTFVDEHEVNICLDNKNVPLWNSFQAYNIIIIAWCKEIMPLCKSSEEFRKVLLAVWASYLRECEAAFIENSNTPRLPLHPKWRDLQIFEHKKKVVSAGKYKIHKPEDVRVVRKGKLVFQISNVENEDSIDNFAELQRNTFSRKKDKSHMSDESKKDSSDDSSNSSENQDNLKCLSMRSRNIIKELGASNIKKASNLRPYFITDITLLKVFCIIILSLRLVNENIFPSDFINWIKQGQFSFFSAARHLPPKWLLLTQDISSFTIRRVPMARSIRLYVGQIQNLLKIDELPLPNIRLIIERYVKDLNLPSSLVNFIMTNYPLNLFPNIQKSLNNSCIDILFSIELVALCLILFTLKRHFCLDGDIEKKISYLAKKESEEAFVWSDWQKQTFFWWKQISLHFLPTNRIFEERALDSDVISNFFNQCAQEWSLPTSSTAGYTGPGDMDSFRQELSNNLFSLINQKNDQFISMPDLSLYHFTHAKKFVQKRLATLGLPFEEMEEDFSNRSIDYLSQEKYKVPFWPVKVGFKNIKYIASKARRDLFRRWPTPFRTLFNIMCFMMGSNGEDLIRVLFSLEQLFKQHDLERDEFLIKIKAKQINSSSSLESEEYQSNLEILNHSKNYDKQYKLIKTTSFEVEENLEIMEALKKNNLRPKGRPRTRPKVPDKSTVNKEKRSRSRSKNVSNESFEKDKSEGTESLKIKKPKGRKRKTVFQILNESKLSKKLSEPIQVIEFIKELKKKQKIKESVNRRKKGYRKNESNVSNELIENDESEITEVLEKNSCEPYSLQTKTSNVSIEKDEPTVSNVNEKKRKRKHQKDKTQKA